MIRIDGAQGEGGGQILRTALTLSVYLGQPIEITKIRAGRRKPGLMRQHLACVRAAQQISGAEVQGGSISSQKLVFKPKPASKLKAKQGASENGHTEDENRYAFSVGSAGSTSLIFQTVFLPLALSDSATEVVFSGGTHNDLAPSYDFLTRSFLPVLEKMGYRVTTEIDSYGFQPVGQGQWRACIEPVEGLVPFECSTRGELLSAGCVALGSQIPEHVNSRELAHLRKRLKWDDAVYQERMVKSAGSGNVVFAYQQYEHITVMCDAVGAFGVSAERVAGRVVKSVRDYLATAAPVESNLADQLLLPMLLGRGGYFVTTEPSEHLRTNISIIEQICGAMIQLEPIDDDQWRVTVPPLASVGAVVV